MTHLKTLNAIYSKAVFCHLVTFHSKPFNCFMLPAMSCSRRRSCCNDPDSFCYICGEYILKEYKRSITDFVRKVYRAYFGVKLGDQDKPWAPHVV